MAIRELQEIPEFEDIVWPTKYICWYIGFWPVKEDASTVTRIFSHFRAYYALCSLPFFLIPEALLIYHSWGNIEVIAGAGCFFCGLLLTFLKEAYVIVRRKRVLRLFKITKELWNNSRDSPDRLSVVKLAYFAKTWSILYFIVAINVNTTFTIHSIFVWIKYEIYNSNETRIERILPFEAWYGVDIQESPTFEITFILQMVTSISVCFGVVGMGALTMTFVLHISAHFAYIREKLRRIGLQLSTSIDNFSDQERLGTEIVQCVDHHRKMLNIAYEMNELFSPMILVQLLLSGFEICLSGYAVFAGASKADFKFVFYLGTMFIDMLTSCWPGEIIMEESESVSNAVYLDIPWHELPSKQRRDLCFIIVRAQKQCRLTAASWQTMSLSKMTDIIRTAGSYFALLRQMSNNQLIS